MTTTTAAGYKVTADTKRNGETRWTIHTPQGNVTIIRGARDFIAYLPGLRFGGFYPSLADALADF